MFAIVKSNFNTKVTSGLLNGCLEALNKEGIDTNIDEIKKFINFLQLNNLIIQPRGQKDNLLLNQKNS